MTHHRLRLACALGLAALAGFALTPAAEAQSGHPEVSPDGEWIAFESSRDGNLDIWIMRTDGSGARNLSDHPAVERHPCWTPDGEWIVFDSERTGNPEIWIMRPDGSDQRQLTDHPGRDLVGRVSPAGDRIAFNSTRSGDWDVWVMGIDGADPRNVTRHPATDILRSWSTDDFLQFDSDREPNADGNRDGWVARPDGSELRRLTDDEHDNRFLRRGPPATTLVALTSDRAGTRGLYLIERTGGEPRVLYDGPGADTFPSWTPDGSLVFFETDESGEREIWRMNAAGGSARQVTGMDRPPAGATHAAWSPTGEWIAFDTERAGVRQVWLLDVATGRPARPLVRTEGDRRVQVATCRPDGRRLVYQQLAPEGWRLHVLDLDDGSRRPLFAEER